MSVCCPTTFTRGTSSAWSTSSYVAKDGEIILEELAGGGFKIKIGNGSDTFADLEYVYSGGGSLDLPHVPFDTYETTPGGPWRVTPPGTLRSATYVMTHTAGWPPGDFEGIEAPAPGPDSPVWLALIPSTGVAGTVLPVYDSADHTTTTGQVLDQGISASASGGSVGLNLVIMFTLQDTEGYYWSGVSVPDGALLSAVLEAFTAHTTTDVDPHGDRAYTDEQVASGARTGSLGLRPSPAVVADHAAFLAAWAAATTAAPIDVVVTGDSQASITRPAYAGQYPWPLLLEAALGGNNLSLGWRYGWNDASGDYAAMGATTGSWPGGGVGTGGFAVALDAGEYVAFQQFGQKMRVLYSRQSGGGTLEVRDGAVGGTLLASVSTAGTAKAGRILDVTLPYPNYLFFGGTTYFVASGGPVYLDGATSQLDSKVRVVNAAHGGWLTNYYSDTPSRVLDYIEAAQPACVIVATGTNDDVGNIASRMTAMFAAIRAVAPSTFILCVGPYVSTGYSLDDAAALRGACEAADVFLLDLTAVALDVPTGDGLHPTRTGHELIANVVAGALLGQPLGGAYRGLARARSLNGWQEVNPQTGTAYTVSYLDVGRTVTRSNAGASTMAWPPDSGTLPIPVGSWVDVENLGAGTVTHSAAAGATLITGSTTSQAQGKRLRGRKVAANTWLLG